MSQAAVDGDEVGEAEFAGEPVGAAEGLGGEGREVVDVLGLPGAEQRLQERVGEHAVVEGLLQAVQRLVPAGVLEQGRHDYTLASRRGGRQPRTTCRGSPLRDEHLDGLPHTEGRGRRCGHPSRAGPGPACSWPGRMHRIRGPCAGRAPSRGGRRAGAAARVRRRMPPAASAPRTARRTRWTRPRAGRRGVVSSSRALTHARTSRATAVHRSGHAFPSFSSSAPPSPTSGGAA